MARVVTDGNATNDYFASSLAKIRELASSEAIGVLTGPVPVARVILW